MSKYYKKIAPQTPLHLSNGQLLKFQPVDNEIGIFPYEGQPISNWMISEIDAAIKGQRGGITEINESEYRELVQKKNSAPLKPRWRQEFNNETLTAARARQHLSNGQFVSPAAAVVDRRGIPATGSSLAPNTVSASRPTASKPPEPN